MPILRLNSGPEGLYLHRSPAPPMAAVRQAARGDGPVIVMIHGFKYDPDSVHQNPHATIFAHHSNPVSRHHVQWLRPLGFDTGRPSEGLAIAFGWRARGNLWRAQRSAQAAGQHLAHVLSAIAEHAPGRPVHVITHSLGSEVILSALADVPAGAVRRIVTLTGASYAGRARAALETPAGRGAELINVISRENDLFDCLFERMIAPPERGDRALGSGLTLPNAVNVQIDCPATLEVLQRFGGALEPATRRVCHWSGYKRDGALAFYARAMRRPETVPLAALRARLPENGAPRWSRLLGARICRWPLPNSEGRRIMAP